ncbi:hypothetical protein [Pseudooceanicola nanhaiensis]|uniref:hypothetical protein n=1 Tax=Pseudooceanicola nanhaiensis TaxID=375761 RepID=UPI004058533E
MRREPLREYEGGWIVRIPSRRSLEIAEQSESFQSGFTYDTALEIPLCFFDPGLDAEAAVAEIEDSCDECERPEIAMNMFAPGPCLAEIIREQYPVAPERVGPRYHSSTLGAAQQAFPPEFIEPSSG